MTVPGPELPSHRRATSTMAKQDEGKKPPSETAPDQRWKLQVFYLCFYGFMTQIRPGESFITPYLLGPDQNFTREEVSCASPPRRTPFRPGASRSIPISAPVMEQSWVAALPPARLEITFAVQGAWQGRRRGTAGLGVPSPCQLGMEGTPRCMGREGAAPGSLAARGLGEDPPCLAVLAPLPAAVGTPCSCRSRGPGRAHRGQIPPEEEPRPRAQPPSARRR